MPADPRRRNALIIVLLLIIAIALLLTRCLWQRPAPSSPAADQPAPAQPADASAPATPEPSGPVAGEVLTPATLIAPEQVMAGAAFTVTWTGPGNQADYVTIVPSGTPAGEYSSYQETSKGQSLELTAPIQPGAHEVRYVTGRSRTVLGRAPIEVVPARATLDAPADVTLGAPFAVVWTGPANKGDYITIVAKDASDEEYANYADTDKGSPLNVTAPTTPGDAELRYVTGQDKKVLARRPIRVVTPEVSLAAPADAIAGATIQVTWAGPNNAGDYITVVPLETPDGQYGNYTNTSKGSPLGLLLPIMAGRAELRYITGQGHRVLSRRPIDIAAAVVTLAAPAECTPGADVPVTWTGPNNPGDYITVVARATPDGQYAAYTSTSKGSPLSVKAPDEAGGAEIRYMTGQGNKVLARIPIKIIP